MKILFFIPTLGGGGAERVLTTVANELSHRDNYKITISVNKKIIVYNVDKKVDIKYATQQVVAFYGKGIKNFITKIQNVLLYRRHTKRIIKEVGPDVIVTFMHCNMLPILMYHGNTPIVSCEHTAMDNKRNSYLGRFFYNRFVDRVLVLTPYDKGYAIAKGVKKVMVMPNPLSWPVLSKDEYNSSFEKRKNILAIGRLDSWRIKGFDLLIQAFSEVALNNENVFLDIAGKWSEVSVNYLESLAKQYGVKNRVRFLGFQSDMRTLISSYCVFVLPSRVEGFPMALIEAMSVGTPVVSFDRLANSIVVDTVDGILVEDGNVKELGYSIEKLLTDEDKRNDMGSQAIDNISRLSPDLIISKWETLFNKLVNS